MERKNYYLRGNYKQQLMRKAKAPTKEARIRFESWLWDKEVLRVFVDASELHYQGIFGLAAIFVGQGSTLVKSKKHYNKSMKKVNIYGEILAVEFALMEVKNVLGSFEQPSKIEIYSDWNQIDRLKETSMLTKRIPTINDVAERINEMKLLFEYLQPNVELEILYMRTEEKKYNPFYKGAHNASKKVIGI